MNIAFVTSEFVTENSFDGGLANYVYRISKSLLEKGHHTTVYLSSNEDKEFIYDGIPVTKVKIVHTPETSGLLRKVKQHFSVKEHPYTKALKEKSLSLNNSIKKSEKIHDVVHYAHLGGLGFYRNENIPSVARISSSTALCNQFGGYGESIEESSAQEKFEFEALRKMDAIFGPSKMVAGIVSKQINKTIQVIETPFFMEKKELDHSVYECKLKNKKYVLFFGSVGLIKGAGTIAEIIHDFLQQNKDYYFVFVGKILPMQGGNKHFMDFIKQKAGVFAERIIHIAPLKHSQLYPIISNSSFCVLPSRIDNFPNTCIEAMAHGKIVIGTWGNGFEQLITDQQNGYLIPVDDSSMLLKKMNDVTKLETIPKILMETGAKKRIENLSPEIIIPQLISFYESAIETFNKKKLSSLKK